MGESSKIKYSNTYIVIPTRNESDSIIGVVSGIRQVFKEAKLDAPSIIVTDDSQDDTERKAINAGCEVIHAGGHGLGYAVYLGLKAAVLRKAKYIVTIDGDGQADASEIPRFLHELESQSADLVVGSRFLSKKLIKYKYSLVRRFGVEVLAFFLRALTQKKFTDSHGGIRAMRVAVAERLQMLGTHSYVQETIIDAVQKGFKVVEIPSIWNIRLHGTSRVVASIPRYVFHTLPILLLRSGKHMSLFGYVGFALILAGFLDFGIIFAQAEGNIAALFARIPSLLLISLLVTAGLQVFFFGFVLHMVGLILGRIENVRQVVDKLESDIKEKENSVIQKN